MQYEEPVTACSATQVRASYYEGAIGEQHKGERRTVLLKGKEGGHGGEGVQEEHRRKKKRRRQGVDAGSGP